jgi:peptide subunit release factor 1 (eRF1)/intein/homing endonuclease
LSTKPDSVKLYKIRKLISELESKEGRGTELVSLYIPPRKPIHEAIANLREEWGTAGNIKSDTTRNHVQDALTRAMQRLKLYRTAPETGLVMFSGALPTNGPGSEVVNVYEIVPPKPVTQYLYQCDDHYHLEFLKDMLREEKVFGLLSIDSSEVGLGILSGDRLEIPDAMTSGISGKTRKGGQCVRADTLVQLEDGRLVPVSRVTPRSRLASYNFVNYSHGVYECTDTFVRVPVEFYEIETTRPQARISATSEHRFFTVSAAGEFSTVQVSELAPGDRVLISRKLKEPASPSLSTGFQAVYTYAVTPEGRDLLKRTRIQKGLSQKRTAKATGLHQAEISQLERGERNLRSGKVRAVVNYLYGNFDQFSASYLIVTRSLPAYFSPELLQLLGYIAGDANAGLNRLCLYEERPEVAETYAQLAKTSLGLGRVPIKRVSPETRPTSFAKKPYLETRIYSKEFVDALKQLYPELVSAKSREIPEQIHRLDNPHLARFLRGLFDAEANVRERRRIGIAMKSGLLIRQLQMLLLRFGIVSSYRTYVNRYGTTTHSLDVSDYESLEAFQKSIGFTATDKASRLAKGIAGTRPQSYHTVPIVGSWVDSRAKRLGIRRKQFPGITNFFHDERGISTRVLGRIIDTFEGTFLRDRASGSTVERLQLLEETISQLKKAEQSELVFVAIKRVRCVKNTTKTRFVDLELPSTCSFIGNGFILHNSARRYERGREMELTYFFNRVGEHATRVFIDGAKVTGLIVGGPGPTKEEFLKGGYLHYELQKKVLAVIDTSYSGREGVRELVDKASETLQGVRLVEEKKLVQKFLGEVNRQGGLAVYGLPRVLDALQKANAEAVLVSDDLDTIRLEARCRKCGTVKSDVVQTQAKIQKKQELISEPCKSCGGVDYDVTERDIVDILEEMAFQVGSKVEIISSGTEEGSMFKNFGGIAAILRYRPG